MIVRINANLPPHERQLVEGWVDDHDASAIDTLKVDETSVTIKGPLASIFNSGVTITESCDHGLVEALDQALASVRHAQQSSTSAGLRGEEYEEFAPKGSRA